MIFMMNNLQPLVENNFELMSYWTFSDIFTEGGFGSQPFHNAYGMQTIRGIAKPVFRALELVYELGSEIAYPSIRVDSNTNDGTVSIFCLKNSNDNNRFGVFIGNWNFVGETIANESISLYIKQNNIPKSVQLYRIDADNVNP